MDQAEFDRMLAGLPPIGKQPATDAPQLDTEALQEIAAQVGITLPSGDTPEAQPNAGAHAGQPGRRPDGTSYSEPPAPEPGLGDASGLDAPVGGALTGVFETKDFLFGDTQPEDRSEFRANVEDTVSLRKEQSMVDGFSAGIGQFAAAMIGLGKVRRGLALIPGGKGIASATGQVAQSAQAALAGAIAFDPHEERLSNLVQDTPLANPLTAWLAADPDDTAAEGRLKAAFESIGLDLAIGTTVFAAGGVFKALRRGDTESAARIAEEFEQAVEQAKAQGAPVEAVEPSPVSQGAEVTESVPETPVSQGEGIPPQGDLADVQPARLDGQTLGTPDAGGGATALPEGTNGPLAGGAPEGGPRGADGGGGSDAGITAPIIELADEDTAAVLTGMMSDADAMAKHGGWYQAIEAGHAFGRGEGIPYRKLNADQNVDDFMARVVDATEEQLDAMKGGSVLTDERVARMVQHRANLFGEDPALLLGVIQRAGKDASHMVAEMEAGYLVSARMFQDSYALAARIKMGDFVEFGSKEGAVDALRQRLSLAASIYGSARSITAASGRAMRRMRGEFKLDPAAVSGLKNLDGDQLAELMVNTGGDPRNIARLANPSLWSKAVDFGQFLLINNLVSGPKTQLINLMTNGYMVGARPLERILGSALGAAKGDAPSRAILQESVRQYAYMGAALGDAWGLAVKAFRLNDSTLSPHRAEVWQGTQTSPVNAVAQVAEAAWKPWDSVPNVLHNVMRVATNAVGLPTRTLGSVDELVKQTVYRSKVMARAHMEGVELGMKAGLSGDALAASVKQHVTDRMHKAFDDAGRGTDPEALREANVATFQQELLPGTLGKTVHAAVANHPGLRLILPFVKTPTNVLRYGWKMSPGLNALQREYRDMWTGRLGKEAQAQAYGQMAMGTLFMGYAAYLASEGSITGGGPSDPKLMAELKATGWQPYSFVRVNADGSKTYVPFNRYDPIAMPFGIIADLQDAITAIGEDADEDGLTVGDWGMAAGALAVGLAKQFASKTYLQSLSSAIEAYQDPDRTGVRWGGQMAANFIPYSAMLRQVNPDPYLREARDVADKMLATVPGLSEKVPAKYDAWGDPVLTRKGLWSSDTDSIVDREVQRLGIEGGATIVRPNPRQGDVDLRDIVLSGDTVPEWAGKNAFEVYQQLAGRPNLKVPRLKERMAKVMQTEGYRRAPDGDADVKGTKLWILHKQVSKYRSAAMKRLKRDVAVRDAFLKETRRVREAYAASRPIQPKPPEPSLGRVGEAFGVDLDALMKPGPGSEP